MLPSSGKIEYSIAGQRINDEHVYQYVHFVAPYNTVIEELTLKELFAFHQRLGLLADFPEFKSWAQKLEYRFQANQQIRMFSSGMKQRIKLGLTLLDKRPLILLDEPGSNLDRQGKDWLKGLLVNLSPDQTLILATNDVEETGYCEEEYKMEQELSGR